jgi:transcriptional regulator with XRE-family HTH domain
MDMQIDSNRIRNERARRAWSQEHLAEVSGVALRTIQRVEANGAASFETIKALAAVFECEVADLRAVDVAPSRRPAAGRWLAGAGAATIVAVAAFFAQPVRAGQVMLDVALTLDEKPTGKHTLITAEGKDAEIRLEGQMRLIVTPRVAADGNVILAIRLFEADGGDFKLVSEPTITAVDSQAAAVNLTSKKGSVFRIAITPHKLND